MELNFYRLIFTNNQEYIVSSGDKDTDAFLKNLNNGMFKSNEFVSLQLKEGEPLNLKLSQLFSVQKTNKDVISNHTKVWKLV